MKLEQLVIGYGSDWTGLSAAEAGFDIRWFLDLDDGSLTEMLLVEASFFKQPDVMSVPREEVPVLTAEEAEYAEEPTYFFRPATEIQRLHVLQNANVFVNVEGLR